MHIVQCIALLASKQGGINNNPLLSFEAIALMLMGPSKSLKQVIYIKLNKVKNPIWPEANHLASYRA